MQHEVRRQLCGILPSLCRFARGLTRSRHDADDLVQMTCERAIARADQWSPDTRLESWAFRIMQTVWFNELRSRKVRQRHGERTRDEAEQESMEQGEALTEARLMLGRVENEIFRLPENERMVLLLVCVEGLSYKEAAEAAGIPIGTVMSRLARARLNLMNRLEAGGGPSDNVELMCKWRS